MNIFRKNHVVSVVTFEGNTFFKPTSNPDFVSMRMRDAYQAGLNQGNAVTALSNDLSVEYAAQLQSRLIKVARPFNEVKGQPPKLQVKWDDFVKIYEEVTGIDLSTMCVGVYTEHRLGGEEKDGWRPVQFRNEKGELYDALVQGEQLFSNTIRYISTEHPDLSGNVLYTKADCDAPVVITSGSAGRSAAAKKDQKKPPVTRS